MGQRKGQFVNDVTVGDYQMWDLLTSTFGEPKAMHIFSLEKTVEKWLLVERQLAWAGYEAGELSHEEAAAIDQAASIENVDLSYVRRETKNVGYPILPLVQSISQNLPAGTVDKLHLGATTQDIMDTALVLQLVEAIDWIISMVIQVGDSLVKKAREFKDLVMAGRTHAQQAVPITFGMKLAVFLDEIARHLQRLVEVRKRVSRVSLFGAAGSGAALGEKAQLIRVALARRLGLSEAHVPWHVSRDVLCEYAQVCAMVSATLGRLAKEVIELSRTEIGEVSEPEGHMRGASSTMPQKANPILSEAILGMAYVSSTLASAMYQAMMPMHERAAGEWHIEWFVLPHISVLAASSVYNSLLLLNGLQVYPERMQDNLAADHGLLMSEAYMIRLAYYIGRTAAHELMYKAVSEVRATGKDLKQALYDVLLPEQKHLVDIIEDISDPHQYIGEATQIVLRAIDDWTSVVNNVNAS